MLNLNLRAHQCKLMSVGQLLTSLLQEKLQWAAYYLLSLYQSVIYRLTLCYSVIMIVRVNYLKHLKTLSLFGANLGSQPCSAREHGYNEF